ncbi:MAG TPA: peptidylprolyl isomerase [Terracidiphilus sp.]|nr:peptidylprolyl isomerase [Terracidiphilus sp.]HUX28192.1 peptidylprolyl isomerase [Terracidiphilus sp.]
MIRFLQTDNRLTKALLVVIIGAASVSMCVYLIPGLMGGGSASADTYAVVYPHWYSRFFSSGESVSQMRVEQVARQQLQQRGPQYADNPMILNFFEQQVGQQLVQQQVMLEEASKLGIRATDEDVSAYLRTGPTGEVLFPDGKFIGDEQYAALISERLNMSVKDFENSIKTDIIVRRLQALISGSVTVSDQEVREAYRRSHLKIKFDYAVISADDLRKTINPSDSELQAFFKKNAARYASAVPEERKITYFAFTPSQIPGGVPQITEQQIQQYFTQHQSEYSVPEQAKSRHILISVPAGADAKTDAAAKAKAESVLKQLQAGGSWTELAKKYSDDPGSKDTGGELGFSQRGRMVPAFDTAIFSQKIGDVQIVKSQFGYHVVQVEARNAAHAQSLAEVEPTIKATLQRQNEAQAENDYAKTLTSEAIKNGLEKTAAAHHLELVTTPPVGAQGVISALPDSSQLLEKAFAAKQGDPPQDASTGEGYAIFQVTGIAAAHAPAFADWKSHVLDDYRDEQLPGLLAQKTMELSERAKSENDLAKAAKEMGAAIKTSDLVDPSGQVPDLGAVAQVAPQLFDLSVGNISGPINAQRTGVVARITDKQEPTADEIAKNFDATRDQLLEERRAEAFNIFMNGVLDNYKKHNLIQFNAKAKSPSLPGM